MPTWKIRRVGFCTDPEHVGTKPENYKQRQLRAHQTVQHQRAGPTFSVSPHTDTAVVSGADPLVSLATSNHPVFDFIDKGPVLLQINVRRMMVLKGSRVLPGESFYEGVRGSVGPKHFGLS